LPSAFLPNFGLTGSAQAKALSQTTGETSGSAAGAGFIATNVFLGQMLNPFGGGPTGNVAEAGAARGFAAERQIAPEAAAAYAALAPNDVKPNFSQRWSLWATSFGGTGYLSGSPAAGSQDVRLGNYGIAAGADFRVDATTMLGFAVAGGHVNWTLGGGVGSGDDDVFQLGVYGMRSWGNVYVGAAAAVGWHGMSTDRNAPVGGGKLSADFDALTFGGRVEVGYRTRFGDIGVTPYAALQALYVDLPAYGETPGGNPFALTFAARTATSVRTELGAWFERVLTPVQDGILVGRARAAWAHDETSDGSVTATFLSLPGASFVVNAASAPADTALLTAAAELRLRDHLSLGLRLDTELGPGAAIYGLRAELKKAW
jgi:outer membrane autotransporter protein